jgi:hypothetical protein
LSGLIDDPQNAAVEWDELARGIAERVRHRVSLPNLSQKKAQESQKTFVPLCG